MATTSFRCTFLLTSDVHSALEAEKDNRVFDPIVTTNAFPSLKEQVEIKKLTPDAELGGAVRRINYIATQREQGRALLFDAGDFLSGTLWFRVLKGSLDVEIMNLMQYDAMTIGNHDFDLGWDHLKDLLKKVAFTVLCSNIFEIDQVSGKRKKEPILDAYKICEVEKGRRVAVIGIMGENSWEAIGKDKKQNLKFRSPDKVLPKVLEDLPPVDYTVLLSHSGIEKDREFAKKHEKINAILGGHSHTLMDKGEQIGKTIVLHPGGKGRLIAKLEVNGSLSQSTAELLDSSWDFTSPRVKICDSAKRIDDLIRENRAKVKEGFTKVVATCLEPISSRDKRNKNTDLGKLLCELLCSVEEKADIAFISSGTIRIDELKKDVTLEDITNMVTEGPVWTISAKGAWVEKIMAIGESRWGGPSKHFQYGGILKHSAGFSIQGEPLENERWYKIRGPKFFFEREDRPEHLVQTKYFEHDETLSELITSAFIEKKEIKKLSWSFV